jgi:arylsulfatase A-like enzyme
MNSTHFPSPTTTQSSTTVLSITGHRSFVALVIIACLAAANPTLKAERPNVILLMGDDHGWEETGYNGHPHLKTPVLDEMAASGLRLDRFYAAHPSCSPTRGSVLTGRHPNRYGTFSPGFSIRPEEISIGQLMRKAGYTTGHFGKWHLGPVKKSSPTNPGAMGFDHWLSHDNFFELDPVLSRDGGPPKQIRGESSEIIIDETIRFARRAKRAGKPFFTIVWFGSPHEPYSGLKRDLALYDNLPARFADKTVSLTSNETGKRVKRPLREVLRERYAEITAMDRAIGKLRTYLKKAELRENTLLWYCGDNGTPSSGVADSPLRAQKGTMYEGGIRVPGVIEWPAKIRKHRATKVNAVTSDMLPTLCALTGQALPNRPLDGINLVPLLDGSMKRRPSPICFWGFNLSRDRRANLKPYIDPELQKGTTPLAKLMNGIATRNIVNYHHLEITEEDFNGPRVILANDYKLVIAGSKKSDPELFHLGDDMAEERNLFMSKPALAGDLEAKLRDWQKSVLKSLRGADY